MMTTQNQFRAAVFDPDLAVPSTLLDGLDRPAGKRFNVYRNNVIVSLKDAMTDCFPVVAKLIGPQNFASLAGLYVRAHPPSDPRMMFYGAEFPALLESFEPLAHVRYLSDVARLEIAQRQSYHAADAPLLDPAIFATLPPEDLAKAKLKLAPAVVLVRSAWPILDIWHFNMTPDAPQPSAGAQDVLITRQEFDPHMHALPGGSADLIEDLQNQTPLGAALEKVEADYPDFNFPALLGFLIQNGALTALVP
jgi:hypothetical protein